MIKIYLLFSFGLLITCNTNSKVSAPNELVGTWKMIEQLADPGDGSGVFNKVERDKTIEFFPDGRFASNESMCMGITNAGLGTYDTKKFTLNPTNCQNEINYQIKDSHLILSFFCIEPCGEKYEKIALEK